MRFFQVASARAGKLIAFLPVKSVGQQKKDE